MTLTCFVGCMLSAFIPGTAKTLTIAACLWLVVDVVDVVNVVDVRSDMEQSDKGGEGGSDNEL